MSACLEHMKSTHEIPLKDFAEATDNYSMIYRQLKSILISNGMNQRDDRSMMDDRARRRHHRSSRPCVFFPAVEYEQTSRLFDWLQEKAEGQSTRCYQANVIISLDHLFFSRCETN
jgi:hypothetical protein